MKKPLILLLAVANLALLVALILQPAPSSALAQGGRNRAGDYLVVTGKVSSNSDAIWILDQQANKLAAFKFDRDKKRMTRFEPRNLKNDF